MTRGEGMFGIGKTEYKNNMKCSWRIQFDKSKVVKLEFLTFDVEYDSTCRYDNVTVYDGVDSSATLQGTFCGGLPRVNISSTNSMVVAFQTDSSVTRNGFRIKYTAVPRSCLGSAAVLISPRGSFGINKIEYKNDMQCGWKIHVGRFKIIRLKFLRLNVQEINTCANDNVTVYDGADNLATRLGTYCGTTLPGYIFSNNNVLFVSFQSDSSVTKNGFKIKYTTFLSCHGSAAILTGQRGKFGINRRQYRNDMRCGWKIRVHPSKIVKLEFLTFDVEEVIPCKYDNVTVYDGEDDSAPWMGTFCGTTLPRDLISSNRSLFVSFKSDSTETKGGFKIKYTAIVGRCRGNVETLTGPEGAIEINQTEYRNKMRCGWRIQVDPSKIVKLEFLTFDVEEVIPCKFDKVTVYDGEDDSAPRMGTFCGTTLPRDFISSNRSLFVSFKSDSSQTKGGFKIKYTASVGRCRGSAKTLTGPEGIIEINQIVYRNKMKCGWRIQVDASKIVKLEFFKFSVEEGGSCGIDNVTVYDGMNDSAPLLGRFCGHTLPGVIISSTNSLFVSFQTDSSLTMDGFIIKYMAIHYVSVIYMYLPLPLQRVLLHFDRFNVQDDKNCARDNVTATYSVTGDQIFTVCGNNLPGDVISSSNQLLVIFKTDSSITSSGFLIKYTTWTTNHVSVGCGQPSILPEFPLIVRGTEAKEHSWPWQISLVLQGFGHICGGSILNKRWIATAAHCVEGKKASQLRVVVGEHNRYKSDRSEVVFEVERLFTHPRHIVSREVTSHDIALIRLKGRLEYNREVAPVCLPNTDISPGTVCVTTGWGLTKGTGDNTVLRQVLAPIIATETCNGTGMWNGGIPNSMLCAGHKDDIKVVCSGETIVLTEWQGEFGTEGHPYYNNEKCRWRIEVEEGAHLKLQFERFELETQTGSACHYDKVNIYDGSDATAELMDSLCGNNLPDNVTTTGNTVFVTFTSDATRVYSGFRISYRTMVPVKGCRGSAATLTGPEGTFGINQTQYENNMRCGWKIQVELSKRVKVEFLTLSVEDDSTCDYDNVKVYDGVDASAPLKGTFCGTKLPRDINSTTNSMFVAFQSDVSVTKDGFKIKYTAIVPYVQSDGRQDQAHLHDRRLRSTSGAGEPVIHLITGMPFPPLFVSDLRWGWECPGS
ncbi:Cubilin [Lamellibrachia satsuma]|nr:Cubilin [Lamellibrachia satsuma]